MTGRARRPVAVITPHAVVAGLVEVVLGRSDRFAFAGSHATCGDLLSAVRAGQIAADAVVAEVGHQRDAILGVPDELRAHGVPVVLLVEASAGAALMDAACEAGPAAIVTAPVTASALLAALCMALREPGNLIRAGGRPSPEPGAPPDAVESSASAALVDALRVADEAADAILAASAQIAHDLGYRVARGVPELEWLRALGGLPVDAGTFDIGEAVKVALKDLPRGVRADGPDRLAWPGPLMGEPEAAARSIRLGADLLTRRLGAPVVSVHADVWRALGRGTDLVRLRLAGRPRVLEPLMDKIPHPGWPGDVPVGPCPLTVRCGLRGSEFLVDLWFRQR